MSSIGIDFGTTNSAVAALEKGYDNILSSDYEPTVLFFEESNNQNYYVGNEAIQKYIESGLKGRFIRSIKSVLHSSAFKFTHIYGKKYYAEDLVALILDFLGKEGTKLLGTKPQKVVLGRPAKFSHVKEKDELAQQRLTKAAQIAGFKEVEFQLEPIAAAFSYEREIQNKEIVLVGDLGGGTSDFTIMTLGRDNALQSDRQKDIIQSAGVRVGGDDFDAGIAWQKIVPHLGYGLEYDSNGMGKLLSLPPHQYRRFCRWENHFLLNSPATIRELDNYYKWTGRNKKLKDFITIIQNNLGYYLFKSIENGKIQLTTHDNAPLQFSDLDIQIEERISLDEFSEAIQKQIKMLVGTIDQLLENARINKEEIDSVFLTGGSSLVRPIRAIFEAKFGKEKIKDSDAFTSVAKGLALQAGN